MSNYVQVPREATEEMIDAGWCKADNGNGEYIKGIYRAMLAAAPQATDPRDVGWQWFRDLTNDELEVAWAYLPLEVKDRFRAALATDPRELSATSDLVNYGVHITKDGKRIAPEDFYADPRDAEIERLTKLNAGLCRDFNSLLVRESHASTDIATLTTERDAAREGNEAVNEKYDTLLKVLSDVYAERDALLEALEPSGETKAAYMGEFTFSYRTADEDGEEVTCTQYVPWDTVKEIMKAIRARALTTQPGKTEQRG